VCLKDCKSVLNYSDECRTAIVEAECAAVVAEPPTGVLAEKCFPSCTAEGDSECNGDELSLCISGVEYIVNCEQACINNGMTYSGECSKAYGEQQSRTGNDQCWCMR